MFIENFRKFLKYYGKGHKIKLFGFFLLSFVAGSLEFLGIALIYPFILLIIQPELVMKSTYYINFSHFFHVNNIGINAFILGLLVVLLFIAKNLFMIYSLYLQNKVLNDWKLDVSKKFMRYYLFSSYKNTLKTSPSEKLYNLNFLVGQSIDGFIARLINLVTNLVIVVMILALLFIKFPLAAMVTGAFVVFSLTFQNRVFKKKIGEIGRRMLEISTFSNKVTMENINNIKEIKILSAQDYFYKEYVKSQKSNMDIMFENSFFGSIPQYIMEIMVVIGLFILAILVSVQNVQSTTLIASYAIIVAATFRIAPALNRIQMSANAINTSRDLVKAMNKEYENCNFNIVEREPLTKLEFQDSIKLKDITFSYRKTPVIKDLSLDIAKGEFVGIIGLSGAGKSTLADIIMGLLPADSGRIYVDGTELNENNFSALRKLTGYVPQEIKVLDGSFKHNVAWGIEEDKIDEEKVVEVLKKARIYDLVNGYDEGVNSPVITGSTGLSQGQKQRLAIARALYRDPEILIFDEATSSLDVETEHEITKMLNTLKGEKTIVAIAHRLSTLKSCDRLIYLKNGKIVDTGSFAELSSRHADFEKLIKLSSLNNK